MRWFFSIILLTFCFSQIFPQVKLYQWRTHAPYLKGVQLAVANDKVYCISEGGFFSYHKSSGSLEKYSKVTGLSDVDYSSIAYDAGNDLLVIGYQNGNIDLLYKNEIYNLPDIKRKLIIGSKSVNKLDFIDGLLYASCGFGIVVIDPVKREVKETYLIGENGMQVIVNQVAFDGRYLYAACEGGVYRADYFSSNLVDFNSWEKMGNLAGVDGNYNAIVFFDNKMYVNHSKDTGDDVIYFLEGDSWIPLGKGDLTGNNYSLTAGDNLVISNERKVVVVNPDGTIKKIIDHSIYWEPECRDAVLEGGTTWIADNRQGLVKISANNQKYFYTPNGPLYHYVWDLDAAQGDIWAAGGGNDGIQYSYIGGYSFQKEKWINFHRSLDFSINEIRNFHVVAVNPRNSKQVFFGSNGYGLIEYYDNQYQETYDGSNSNLEYALAPFDVRISGLAFDDNENLWIAEMVVNNPVYVKPPGKEIEKIKFKSSIPGNKTGRLLVTSTGQKWLILNNVGLFVFDHQPGGGEYNEKVLRIIGSDGEMISSSPYSLAEDLDGNIWIGTDKGPVVYYNPEDVFTSNIYASKILISRNDGSNLADVLLETETITSISIDGAGRKWFGTSGAGVFLLSKDATKQIYNFTAENSPMPSSNIIDISINHLTGEVFFGTDKGIISFKGDATKGNDDFGRVYTYPNPVRENYQGDITVTGLLDNVDVKITDVSGNLVFETTALGGQAIWNGRNMDGIRVSTGVYLVFCTNSDGSKTYVTKILFIN